MSSEFKSKAVSELSLLRPNSTFLTIKSYINNYGEESDFSLCFHVNYINLVKKSKFMLSQLKFSSLDRKTYGDINLKMAKENLNDSFNETLNTGYNSAYTLHGVYDKVKSDQGSVLPGILLHINQDILHLEGCKIRKTVLVPIIYPKVDSLDYTVARNFIRRKLPIGAWRQFKLTKGKFKSLTVEKITLKEEDFIKQL